MQPRPKISIVSYSGEHGMLPEILASLAQQDAAPKDYEVVVVDYNPHTDWPLHAEEFARRTPHLALQYHQLSNGSRARALNLGVLHARADLVVFLADDFVPCLNFVSSYLGFHEEHPATHIVGIGPGLFPSSLRDCAFRRWLEDSGTLFGVSFTQAAHELPDHFFYAANSSLKKAFFDQAGGCDEDFPGSAWDDYELGVRLKNNGMQALPVAGATARHEHSVTLAERCGVMHVAAAAAIIFEGKYPGAQPWQAQCHIAPWQYRVAGAARRFRHRLSRKQSDLDNYYHQMVTASFVEAYRSAKKHDRRI